ncbi:MAG: CPBP family intramembrane metalloprotease [Gemmatimonadales bacterium]|nr:CPBP family intramembrane metalloprotease [Gemmatimonadales bacterium]
MTAVTVAAQRPTAAKAIGWSVAFMLLGGAFTMAFYTAFAFIRHGGIATAAPSGPSVEYVVATGLSQLAGFGLATWIIGVRVLGLSAVDLRWRGANAEHMTRAGSGLARGLLLGISAAALALLVAVPAGAGWSSDRGTFAEYVGRVGLTFLALAAPAMSEEVAFRGLPLVLLATAFGRWPALVALALLFGAAHLLNPAVTSLGVANIALAGIFLGIAFFAPGGIWTAFGAHLGWNAALAAADAPVSGLPFTIPFIDHHAGAPAWFTGGSFGPEGGLAATLAIAVASVVAWRWAHKESA